MQREAARLHGRMHPRVSIVIDGHHLAESAMDNATGVAGAIAIARTYATRLRSASSSGCQGMAWCLLFLSKIV